MILVALGLIAFGVADLLRWSPDAVGLGRATAAAGGATAVVAAVAALGGAAATGVLATAAVSAPLLLAWTAYEWPPKGAGGGAAPLPRPELVLLLLLLAFAVLFALSGSVGSVEGEIAEWYSDLSFPGLGGIPVDQFVLGAGAALFLLATANRIVRFLLATTETSVESGEVTLRGGRLLGPMERLIVAAAIVSGQFAAAGFVIAAKGLLRFPEIRAQRGARIDEITEYFLIGTFASVVVTGAISVLVLVSA